MVVLEAGGVRKAYGPTTVLEKVAFKIRRGEKVGLVGPNGCGKSTLLKMIAGLEEVTEGTIATTRGVRIGYLAQEMAYRDGNTVHEELCHVFDAVRSVEAELRSLETTMEQSASLASAREMRLAVDRYGRLMEAFERLDGFAYGRKIDTVLDGLKLSALRDRRVGSLSGGEKNIVALELHGYTKAFGPKVLFRNAHLNLSFGDRVGLIGANGTGKTTLFKDIVQTAAWENAVLRTGPRVRLGYYAQEHETLSMERTIVQEVQAGNTLTREQAGSVLTRYLFRWEDIDRKVRTLSGGEKSRLQLAKLVLSGANLLLLDEPTNHLDIQSREQVEEALEAFEGTVFVISHDRYFLDRIVDRIVEIRDGRLVEYPGGFTQYWEKRRAPSGSRKRADRRVGRQEKARARRPSGNGRSGADVETRIDALETEKLELERGIAAACQRGRYKEGDRLGRKLGRIERQLEGLYEML